MQIRKDNRMEDRKNRKSAGSLSTVRLPRIREESWHGQQAVALENEHIRVIALPGLGGKIASIILRRSGFPDFELAAQPGRIPYRIPKRDTGFAECDASGIDDAFPTIDPGSLPGDGRMFHYTDHGEIWRSPFAYKINKDSLAMEYESMENPFFYRKTLTLLEQGVRIRWHIANTGDVPFPFLWTMHGLVRYEPDMELLYPEEIRLFLNVLDCPELKSAGTEHVPGTGWDFHRVPAADSGTQMKYYAAQKVYAGWCGYRYPGSQVRCILRYDAEKLPWLGMWITAGGFRGDYNCAWEPSTGFYDGVERARETDTLRVLDAGETFEFEAEYRLEGESC